MKKLIEWITKDDKIYKRSDKIIVTIGLLISALLCLGLLMASEYYVTLWLFIIFLFIYLLMKIFSLIDKYFIKDIHLTKHEMKQIARKNLRSARFIHNEYGETTQAELMIHNNLEKAHDRDFQIVFRGVNCFVRVFFIAYAIHFLWEKSYRYNYTNECENLYCKLIKTTALIPPDDDLSYSLASLYAIGIYVIYIFMKKLIHKLCL